MSFCAEIRGNLGMRGRSNPLTLFGSGYGLEKFKARIFWYLFAIRN